jgi:hypothetical protein
MAIATVPSEFVEALRGKWLRDRSSCYRSCRTQGGPPTRRADYLICADRGRPLRRCPAGTRPRSPDSLTCATGTASPVTGSAVTTCDRLVGRLTGPRHGCHRWCAGPRPRRVLIDWRQTHRPRHGGDRAHAPDGSPRDSAGDPCGCGRCEGLAPYHCSNLRAHEGVRPVRAFRGVAPGPPFGLGARQCREGAVTASVSWRAGRLGEARRQPELLPLAVRRGNVDRPVLPGPSQDGRANGLARPRRPGRSQPATARGKREHP